MPRDNKGRFLPGTLPKNKVEDEFTERKVSRQRKWALRNPEKMKKYYREYYERRKLKPKKRPRRVLTAERLNEDIVIEELND